MGQQSVKQAARRAALDAQNALRQQRAEQTRRWEAQALDVLVALGERDAAVAAAELHAGNALLTMTRDGSLTLQQAIEWCGDALTVREATRLRQLAEAAANGPVARTNGPVDASRAVAVRATAGAG